MPGARKRADVGPGAASYAARMTSGTPGRRRRDRRGHGLRGLLVPHPTGHPPLDRRLGLAAPLPLARTRSERFDDLVLDARDHLMVRWGKELQDVDFAVADVPPEEAEGIPFDEELASVPLAAAHPARRDAPARIVLYRRPIEARAIDELDKADLVLDIVIHEVADLLGVGPDVIDPEGHGDPDDV